MKPLILTYDVLDLLSYKVKLTDDKNIVNDFSKLCLKMEIHAEAWDVSISDVLMEPVSTTCLEPQGLKRKIEEEINPISWSAQIVDMIFQPQPGQNSLQKQNKHYLLF